jgi:hypothetical protein
MNPLSILGLIPSLFQAGYGIYQNSQANKLAANTTMPQYNIPAGYQQNVDLASNMAQTGLPQSTTNYFTQNANRGLTTGINAVEKTGQGVNAVSNLYGDELQGFGKIASEDALAKQANEQGLMTARNALSNQQALQWNQNQNLPYLRNLNTINQLKFGGAQNVFGGLSGLATTGANVGNGVNNNTKGAAAF